MVKVKICGITNPEDASMAAELGADALGFIFSPGPRQTDPVAARSIIERLPPFVKTVGVFVDEALEIVRAIRGYCGLDTVQLHGNEPPEFCSQLMPGCIKAFRMKDESSTPSVGPYQGKVNAVLLDTYKRGVRGGTGETFDWDLALRVRETGLPIVLSGGLNPSNIQSAISRVRPYAVDVNSGIELRPGKKDRNLVERLMRALR